MDIEITITGYGNPKEVAKSLKKLAKNLSNPLMPKEADKYLKQGLRVTWEDPTLCATIGPFVREEEVP